EASMTSRVACARRRDPRRNPELVASDDVPYAEWSRGHREVLPGPAERAHDRPGRLTRRDLHRGRGEHARRDEVDVRHAQRLASAAVDERSEAASEGAE